MTNISERSPLMRAKLSEPEKENWRFWWKLSLENFIVVFSLTSGLFLINTLPFIFSKTRLVRELEKKFSGRHVVIVAQVCNVWLFLLHFIVWVFFLHPFGIQHFYDHWIKWQYSLCLWENDCWSLGSFHNLIYLKVRRRTLQFLFGTPVILIKTPGFKITASC